MRVVVEDDGHADNGSPSRPSDENFAVLKRRHFYGRDFIDLLFVAPDARLQGIGRSLVRASVIAATTARVFTSTNKSNLPMQALMRSEGWSSSGELDGLDEGDPELVYYWSR